MFNATALHALKLFLAEEAEYKGYDYEGSIEYVITAETEDDNFYIFLSDEVTVKTKNWKTIATSFKHFCQLHNEWRSW